MYVSLLPNNKGGPEVLLPATTLQAKFWKQGWKKKGVFIQKLHNFGITVFHKCSHLSLSIKAKIFNSSIIKLNI